MHANLSEAKKLPQALNIAQSLAIRPTCNAYNDLGPADQQGKLEDAIEQLTLDRAPNEMQEALLSEPLYEPALRTQREHSHRQ